MSFIFLVAMLALIGGSWLVFVSIGGLPYTGDAFLIGIGFVFNAIPWLIVTGAFDDLKKEVERLSKK